MIKKIQFKRKHSSIIQIPQRCGFKMILSLSFLLWGEAIECKISKKMTQFKGVKHY